MIVCGGGQKIGRKRHIALLLGEVKSGLIPDIADRDEIRLLPIVFDQLTEVLVAKPEIQREFRSHLEVVLEISRIVVPVHMGCSDVGSVDTIRSADEISSPGHRPRNRYQ